MRSRGLLVVVAVLAFLNGCGSEHARTRQQRTAAGTPYQLYTHCGMEWARIHGVFWRATVPLSDGSGNPPSGWDNPYQGGRLIFTTSNSARFVSPAGTVVFKRTSRTRPPFICS